MPSVVIAAHDEEAVIGACLDAVLAQESPADLEIVVSANGCSDRTAEIARRPGVTVIDRAEPGKAEALNAGDLAVTSFPRMYLDADIVLPPHTVHAVRQALSSGEFLAAVPGRRIDTANRPWPVRAYYSINELLPYYRTALFGRGLIVLTEAGRSRFDRFPPLVADDLFVDSFFAAQERAVVETVQLVVQAPHTTRDLVRRLVRVRRGNAQMRATTWPGMGTYLRKADRWSWWRDVVRPNPRLLPAAIPYVVITLAADLLAKRPARAGSWGRDESTRRSPTQPARSA